MSRSDDDVNEPKEDGDLGPPARELAGIGVEPDRGFLAGIRARIRRRESAGHMLDFSMKTLSGTLIDYLVLLLDALFGGRPPNQERR